MKTKVVYMRKQVSEGFKALKTPEMSRALKTIWRLKNT